MRVNEIGSVGEEEMVIRSGARVGGSKGGKERSSSYKREERKHQYVPLG